MSIQPGRSLLHYELVERIGEGGMGVVWKAVDTTLDREIAIKLLPPGFDRDRDRLARFTREAKLLASLRHPGIATIFGLHETDGVRFLAMELLDGETLAQRLKRSPMAVEEALGVGLQIARALVAAHASGVVHRDLKPANVMLTAESVKILDFGLAKRMQIEQQDQQETPVLSATATLVEDLTREGTTLGTVAYMAPEQLRAETADARADIFSFGVLLYEMISGIHPFRREHTFETISGILRDEPPALSQQASGVPGSLEPVVRKLLSKKTAERYQNFEEVAADLSAVLEEMGGRGGIVTLRRPRVLLSGAVLLAVAIVTVLWWTGRNAAVREAREKTLPEVARLIDSNWRDFGEAYAAAVKAERVIPDDPDLQALFARCSVRMSLDSVPQGARVVAKSYRDPQGEWLDLGVTPLEDVRMPIGIFRWRFEKDGYDPVDAVASTWQIRMGTQSLLSPNHIVRTLDPNDTIPTGMVRVQGTGPDGSGLPDFFIDRFEVTNREYREFVEAGGYTNPDYWRHPFDDNGSVLDRAEAMARFVDRTGVPGPSTWSGGVYAEGQDDYPVSGISWYEAAAYAEFAGKSLPSTLHWGLARGEATMILLFPQLGGYATFAPFSNFEGNGPVAVGHLPGTTPFGAYDMAGNVREWCSNSTASGHAIRGGSWSDTTYMFHKVSQLPSMDRSAGNGVRCVVYPERDRIPQEVFAAVGLPQARDLNAVEPVSDPVFEAMRRQFDYDPLPLDARVESRVENPRGWIHETVSYDAAYGGERILAHLFLPRGGRPPFQTVVYFPGSGSLVQESSADIETYFEFPVFISHLVANGRAVLYPVYKGTFERRDPALAAIHSGDSSRRYNEYLTQLVKDFRRSIDYLELREDIDTDKLAFYGMSWGGFLGGVIPAIEDRLVASVLISGGAIVTFAGDDIALFPPESDPVNYLPRVKIPTLMLNGRYDMLLPLDDAIRPMFELLGTPDEHKELMLFETDHIPPRDEFVKATLGWLDRYLGPVEPL